MLLASEEKDELEQQTQAWSDRLAHFDIRLNVKRTEYMTTKENESGTIKVDSTDLPRTTAFRYPGSLASSDGSHACEIIARINATWLKWRSMTGVLCDRNIPDHLKSKITELWYDLSCCTEQNVVLRAKKWNVALESWRRRCCAGWLASHVLTVSATTTSGSDDETVCKIGLYLDVPGKRPKCRPKQRWLDTLHYNMKLAGTHPDEARDQIKWRQGISKADPAIKWEKL